MSMKHFECIVTAQLKQDVHHLASSEYIGKGIHQAMQFTDELSALHARKGYKNYVYSNLYPLEKDGVYKKGHIYIFRIRSTNHQYIELIKQGLKKITSDFIKVISVELIVKKFGYIDQLVSITPVISTKAEGSPWLPGDHLEDLQALLHSNVEKKAKSDGQFQADELVPSFIKRIELVNRKPIPTSYKGIKLLGNKVKIEVREDQTSQLLAHYALYTGLGEKNSVLGTGFCFANFL